MSRQPIGVFDSGVGGLTVVAELRKVLPNEEIVYFGDTARVPYGSKSKETVTKYACEIMDFLLKQDVKAVVVACNTVSSNSYEELTTLYSVPIIEMVEAGVVAGKNTLKTGKIGVLGTEATIRSKAYERALLNAGRNYSVVQKACPLFVPLAEENWTENEVANLTAKAYLQDLVDAGVNALLLGCTHYPLLRNCIEKAAPGVEIINPAEGAAYLLSDFLRAKDLLNKSGEALHHRFYISDNTDKFDTVCRLVLKEDFKAEKVDLLQQ